MHVLENFGEIAVHWDFGHTSSVEKFRQVSAARVLLLTKSRSQVRLGDVTVQIVL